MSFQQNMSLVSNITPSFQQTEPNPSQLTSQQQTMQYLLQNQQRQQEQQQRVQSQQTASQVQPQIANDSSRPESPIPSTMMGQLMGALNNTSLLDDLNINIETLQGFDCDIDEVCYHI